ncbi:sodium ion-translocating decarboxylase subunit beta, partial [Fervidicola ferrireducens]|uniref:sodium ion-translocating decarboxylase subunit beta n=1 Tax=Fervidicola ferrireducens TaxID=520764 RepID=UPI000B164870
MLDQIINFFKTTGYFNVTPQQLVMLCIAFILMYLAIVKKYEPLLLVPISFGMMLANIPVAGLMEPGGFLYWIYQGVKLGVFPPLIFLGVGAMTDFGPLIAYPKSLLLGAAAQLGIFITFLGATLLGFNVKEAASIG